MPLTTEQQATLRTFVQADPVLSLINSTLTTNPSLPNVRQAFYYAVYVKE